MTVSDLTSISIVDLSCFISDGDFETRKSAARDLADKVHINGCVGVKGHGVSSERLKEAFDVVRKLFDLPYEEKMRAPHPNAPVPHRGYSGIGREQGAAKSALESTDEVQKETYSKTTDFKESYEIGSDKNREQYNIWLPEDAFPGFRKFTTDLFWELDRAAGSIFDALIMSLELKDDEVGRVRSLVTGHDNQLRLLHYPPVKNQMTENEDMSRLGAHTDWSLFTMLFQDSFGGLEFLDRETNQFLPATPIEGVLYMNIGDMFQRLSNGFYPSALHRVVSPQTAKGGMTPVRYSIPFFVTAQPDEIVEPQPSSVTRDGKQAYEPVTTRSYSEAMFNAVNVYS